MRLTTRKGFALPVAIGSMVIIGTLIAGVFFTASQESRVSRNTLNQERAFRAAEGSLNYVYGTWKNANYSGMAVGAVKLVIYDSLSKRGWIDTVRVTRLNGNTYWLLSTAYAGTGIVSSRHRTSVVVRITYPTISFLGALTVRGSIRVGGSSYTTGTDSPPAGWGCPPGGATQPGIAASSDTSVKVSGCSNTSCIDGNPPILVTNAASDTTTYFNYGDANWATLTSSADLTFSGSQTLNGIAPSTISGACNTGDLNNWGDPGRATPAGACESYYPIVYFSGTANTVHITGGTGQGLLLVDGDLTVDGGFEWFGPVIIRGHLTTQGTGGHFNGAVMAANADLEQNTVLGDAIIRYSSCADSAALLGTGIAKRLKQRSWAEMF
jgi:hypothetical protein